MPGASKCSRRGIAAILINRYSVRISVSQAESEVRGASFLAALNEKLIEELEEYIQDHKVEELVDLLEVAPTIAKLKGVSEDQLLQMVEKERLERGGFTEGTILEGYR